MRWPVALAFALPACGAGQPAIPHQVAHPVRVMSTNQCADQLVLALLPPDRIASVTWLSRDPGGSLMAREAAKVAVNHGRAEEVIAQAPDLVVAGSYTTPALKGMLRRLGYPMIEVDDATDVAGVRRITRQVAAAVGERAHGEALIARMDAKFAALADEKAPPVRVAAWDRTGFAAGAGTIYDVILTAAGGRNVARDAGGFGGRRPDVEALLQADPALLVQGSRGDASLGDDLSRHRAIRERWRGKTATIPQGYYACGTPMIADAALRLRAELR